MDDSARRSVCANSSSSGGGGLGGSDAILAADFTGGISTVCVFAYMTALANMQLTMVASVYHHAFQFKPSMAVTSDDNV